MPTKIFGIRHHGAGSAKSLKASLEAFKPDVLLIEGPADAASLIPEMANKELQPPVAILVYNPDELSQASFFPFADFSPEWVAVQYGLCEKIAVQFIDLPQSIQFGITDQSSSQQASQSHEDAKEQIKRDPLAYVAEAAGYVDGERWWEVMIEQRDEHQEIFEAITELMCNLRSELQLQEAHQDVLREACMRTAIRKAEKEFEKVAVVCGAWHVPALLQNVSVKEDYALLKGLKKIKTTCTWVPWTYQRLTFQSGYGAGIISPAWYELLFHARQDAVVRWFVQVARLFRKEGLDASSAHVIEAVRMAESLAAIRSLSLPGLQEMYESTVSIFCGGYEEAMQLIQEKLIIGDKMGSVPESAELVPLQKDIQMLQKKLKLKPLSDVEVIDLDLRKEMHLERSYLLHRLHLLNIPWGIKKEAYGKKGTFHEYWSLQWKPEFALNIIEASIWGNTVVQSATQYVIHRAQQMNELDQVSQLLESLLHAELKDALPAIVQKLLDLATLTRHVQPLMRSLKPLVNISRYGNVRKTETDLVAQVIHQIVPRICTALPSACHSLNEEASAEMFSLMLQTHSSIGLSGDPSYQQDWQDTLMQLADYQSTHIHALIQGAAARLLLESDVASAEQAAVMTSFALSPAQETLQAAYWLQGFLHGNALLLLNNASLWYIIDTWVAGLTQEAFQHMLPLLRRTFSNFTVPERQKIAHLAKHDQHTVIAQYNQQIDEERAQLVLPIIQELLGL